MSDGFWNHFDRQAAPTPALELNEVVLDYLHPDEATTLLTWDGSAFALMWRNDDIEDLATGENEAGHLNFKGMFVDGEPQISGWVQSAPEEEVWVFIDNPDEAPHWFITDGNGNVLSMLDCVCNVTQFLHCPHNQDCVQLKACPIATEVCIFIDPDD